MNEKFLDKISALIKQIPSVSLTEQCEKYLDYFRKIDNGVISFPGDSNSKPLINGIAKSVFGANGNTQINSSDKKEDSEPAASLFSFKEPESKTASETTPSAFNKPANEGRDSKPAFAFGKSSESKPTPFSFEKDSTSTKTTPAFSFGTKPSPSNAEEQDTRPKDSKSDTIEEVNSDSSDDEIEIKGPQFTLDKPPIATHTPFSFKSTTEPADNKPGFKFESSAKAPNVFMFPEDKKKEEEKTEESKKEEAKVTEDKPGPTFSIEKPETKPMPFSGFSFSKPSDSATGSAFSNNTWSPEKGVKFGTADTTNGSSAFSTSSTINTSTTSTTSTGSVTSTGSADTHVDVKPFSFGEKKPESLFNSGGSNSKANPFSFGSTPGTANPFSFGSTSDTAKLFTFGSATTTTSSAFDAPTTNGATDAPSEEAPDDETPAEPQQDLSEKGPGEEQEDVVYEKKAKIYEVVNGEHRPLGLGPLRVLCHEITKKSRLLVRAEGSGRVIINVLLRPQVKYPTIGKGQVKVLDFNAADKPPSTYVIRVKTEQDGRQLSSKLEEYKA